MLNAYSKILRRLEYAFFAVELVLTTHANV